MKFQNKMSLSLLAATFFIAAFLPNSARAEEFDKVCDVTETIGSSCDKDGFNCSQQKITQFKFNGKMRSEKFQTAFVSGFQVELSSGNVSQGKNKPGMFHLGVTIEDELTGSKVDGDVSIWRDGKEQLPQNVHWLASHRKNGDGVVVLCHHFLD